MSDSKSAAIDERVALIALIVSLVALVATTGQLLQQYFATADGYRRCQMSVMGAWGKKTRLRWRWRQFRFETLYSTPEIFMTDMFYPICPAEYLLGMNDLETNQLWSAPGPNNYGRVAGEYKSNGDLVGWLELLSRMHRSTHQSMSPSKTQDDVKREIQLVNTHQQFHSDYRRVPAIEVVERSWDFQPPDVSRPLAKTTLSTLAVMARRMGMRWKEFRPEDGVLHAEGSGHVLTSTVVRTLGLVMQYNYHGQTGSFFLNNSYTKKKRLGIARKHEEIYIPSREADSLGAGVVRGDERLGLSDFLLNTQDDIVDALELLVPRDFMGALLRDMLRFDHTFRFPVGDLVALSMIPMCLPNHGEHMSLVQIPAPSDNPGGVTTSKIGRYAFRWKLRVYLKSLLDASESESSTQTDVSEAETSGQPDIAEAETSARPDVSKAESSGQLDVPEAESSDQPDVSKAEFSALPDVPEAESSDQPDVSKAEFSALPDVPETESSAQPDLSKAESSAWPNVPDAKYFTQPAKFTAPWVLAQFGQLIIEAEADDADNLNVDDDQWLVVRRRTKLITWALDMVAQCSDYFSTLRSEMPLFKYSEFLGSHLRCCVFGFQQTENFNEAPGFRERSMMANFTISEFEQVVQYFERLPLLAEHWKVREWKNEQQVFDVWTVMMLRSFCWGICHSFVPGERVPIRYYGSQLPVWLS